MNLIQSLAIILIIITIGYVCGKKKIFNDTQIEGFEVFLFKVAIPFFLFSSILTHDFITLINVQYIYCYITCFLGISIIVTGYFLKKNQISEICIKILASGYVNAAIYTLPIITFLLGDPKAAILGNLVQVIIFQSIFLIILSFIKHKENNVLKKLSTSLSSPMVLFPLVGMILSYQQIKLPIFIIQPIQNLGNSASSLALFVFGLTISHIKIKIQDVDKDLVFVILTKNLIHPCLAILLGHFLFRLDSYWLHSLIIAASAPTAFVVYLITKQFSTETRFVKNVVAITSIVSLLFILLFSQIFRF